MMGVALLQERIGKHLAQWRRDVHRETRLRTRFVQALKDKNQRKIDLGDRLVKPVFLKKFGIFRVPDKRQVSVKDQAEISSWHRYQWSVVGGQLSVAIRIIK